MVNYTETQSPIKMNLQCETSWFEGREINNTFQESSSEL